MIDYVLGGLGALILAVFGFLIKRNAMLHDDANMQLQKDIIKLEKELDGFERRLRQAMSRQEVRELLDDKLEPIHVLLKEIKEDIRNNTRSNG